MNISTIIAILLVDDIISKFFWEEYFMKSNKYLVLILTVFSLTLITVCSPNSNSEISDKEQLDKLQKYFQKSYAADLPPDAQLEVTGFEDAEIPEMRKGNIKITFSGRSVDIPFMLDKSGKYAVLGKPIDTKTFEDTPIKGLKKGSITIARNAYPVLLTEDSKYIIAGEVIDTTVDRAKQTMDKISLKDVPTKGNKNAKVTVVEYSDFQCPFCRRANPILDQVLTDYKDNIKIVYKQYPLPNHNWAKPASIASICSYKEAGDDKFWKFHDKIFENQSSINLANSADKFKEFAKELKIDEKKFTECLSNPTIAEKVQQEMAEGQSVGINSTPSFIVNGIMVRGANADGLKSAIEVSLN
jgi:protein-disulfide isomerase